MASGLTPIYSIPYPLLTDSVNVHGDMEDLASRVEDVLEVKANLNVNNLFTGTSSFLVNTSTPAVRITQTGFGAALLVEDASSPDTTPFIVDFLGRVGIGINAPEDRLHVADGSAIFDAGVLARSGLTVGTETGTPVVMQVYGRVDVSTTVFANTVESATDFSFFNSLNGASAKLLAPILDQNYSYQFPAVDGTVITTGNLVEAYPSQIGNSGKVLTTNGAVVSWSPAPNQVPDIIGNAGRYLTNDGTSYFWEDLLLIPALDPTPDLGTANKWLTNNGNQVFWDFLPGDEPFIEVTEDIVLTVGANLFCDTRGGNISITLPPNPLPGSTVSVFDTQDFFQSNYVIIKPGVEKINGIEGDLILDVGGATVVFIYINELIGWRVA